MRWVVCTALILTPQTLLAAVSFSEVAWMGSTDSASHEWIELRNDGAVVDVSGWTIDDGMNLSIELVGTIPANQRVVLERTSDASVAGTAFLIYTGALVNTGATLSLRRPDGSLVDRVVGGADWENIGGDNTTKETAQYTEAGWITAAATPGAPPPAQSDSESTRSTAEDQPSGVSATDDRDEGTVPQHQEAAPNTDGGSADTIQLTLSANQLELSVGAPVRMYVNQSREFTVEPSGVGDRFANSVRYRWNFGDGHTATGQTVSHTYAYPGTYVVTVHGRYKRQEHVVRHVVTVLPVRFALSLGETGDVLVHNEASYDVNLSGYRVIGEDSFRFASYTILKSRQTITIPEEWLGATQGRMLGLYDQVGELVASYVPTLAHAANVVLPSESATPPTATVRQTPRVEFIPSASARELEAATDRSETDQENGDRAATSATPTAPATVSSAATEPTSRPDDRSLWILVALMCAVILGIYVTTHRSEAK